MKNNIFITILLLIGVLILTSCEPQQDSATELGLPPSEVSFDIEPTGDINTFKLTNTTPGTFIHKWELGNGSAAEGESVEVGYQLKGDYEVTLQAFNSGGFATATKTISVLEDAPTPCLPNSLMEFLSDCGTKTWKLKQGEGAYWVGPDPGTTWWANSEADFTARPCAFNDEWIFSSDGTMVYDTKGDVWAEDYMGFNFECVADGQLPPAVAAWASGNHTFFPTEGSLEQIQLIGLGAFMGLPKAANGAEVTEPQQGVTYDVISRGTGPDGDFLEIEVNYTAGIWRFNYISN